MNDAKYRMLVEMLKSNILSGKYGNGNPFPSVRSLIRRYGLSNTTVLHALDELVHQGLISRKQGRGTFVSNKGASRKIGLIVPGVAYSEFFQPIVGEISHLSQEHGYMLLFGNITSNDPAIRVAQAKRFARELVREGVAGVIYQPLEFIDDPIKPNAEIVAVFDEAKIPVVLIDYDIVPPPERSKYDLIGINNFHAGYLLANHLKSVGARKIDFVMRPNCSWSVHGRLNGVRAALFANNKFASRTLVSEPDDLTALRRHLKGGHPDAFVCGTDAIAAKFKRTLEKVGLKVPKNVLLAGFDDVQIAALLSPPLTTVHQPCKEIGATAFKLLIERMEHLAGEAREINLSAQLMVRESTCPANSIRNEKTTEGSM